MKKILLLSIILLSPAPLYANDIFNVSGIKMFSSSYTDLKGDTSAFADKSEGLQTSQSTRLLLEGKTKDNALSAYMNYDDTRQINPLEMLVKYQKDIFSASLGHQDIVLNETEFSGYNSRMFGVKAGVKTDKFQASMFEATNRGIPKTANYQGNIGHGSQYISSDGYEQRKYYQLLPEGVNAVLMDDGISENGEGFGTLTLNTDYTIRTQTLGSTTTHTLILTTPAETDAIIQVNYEQSGQRIIKGSEMADEEIRSYYRLTYRDVIAGSEVITIGSSTLIKGTDYEINYSDGSVYFATRTTFNINYDYAAKTYQLDPPVLPGSERVTVNGSQKQRDLDYCLNYETGELRFFDEHLSGIYADSKVEIEYETIAEGNRYSLTGMRSGYAIMQGIDVGCTWLLKSDAANNARVSQSLTRMRQQILGVDTSIHLGDKLKITGELAASRKEPGNKAKLYIDDMEGDDLLSRWKALTSGVKLSVEKNSELISHPEATDNHQALRIIAGPGTNTIERILVNPLDLSLYADITCWIQAQGTSVTATLCLYSASNNWFSYDITTFTKWNLTQGVVHGEPDLKTINRIQLILNNTGSETATLYIDDLIADNGLTHDGTAKKLEAELSIEQLKLKTGVKDISAGFNPIGLSTFEAINDTRSYYADAQIPLIQSTMLLLKYENKLKSKSAPEKQIEQDVFSTAIKFEPSDMFKVNLDYKQEDENDSKAVHQIENVSQKTTGSIDYAKENILHLSRFRVFNRLMNINSRDNVHNLHTSANHSYLRFNLEPVTGIEFVPEYKLKSTRDINKDSRISEEENILSAVNITSSDKLSGVLRYAHDSLSNFVLDSKQYNQTLSLEFGLTPNKWPSLNTFLENTRKKYLQYQTITSQTVASGGDMKLSLAPSEKWKWLIQYRFSNSDVDGMKNKTDNYTGELTRWFRVWKQAGTSSLTPRICQDSSSSGITDTYLVIWETILKQGLTTRLSYEYTEKGTSTKNIPYIKVGYTAERWNVFSEFKQTIANNQTTDRLSSIGTGYKIKDKLTLNDVLTCARSTPAHNTSYSSSLELNWSMNKMLNLILKDIWSDIHDHLDTAHNRTSHKVNMDVSIAF